MNQSQITALTSILGKIAVLLTLLTGSGATTAPVFGLGTGASNVSVQSSVVLGSPQCATTFSNIDSSYGLNTCPYMTAVYAATTTYPAVAITLGPYSGASSTTSTVMGIPFGTASGLTAGDSCSAFYNGAQLQGGGVPLAFFTSGIITGITTSTASATVTLFNGNTNTSTVLTVTSTLSGVSSTLKAVCFSTVN